jgi:hypothetical protein
LVNYRIKKSISLKSALGGAIWDLTYASRAKSLKKLILPNLSLPIADWIWA